MVVVALAAVLAWWSSAEAPPHRRSDGPTSRDASAPSDAIAPPPSPSSAAPSTTTPSTPHELVASPTGPIDPCGDGEDDPPIERPSLDELLQLHIAELNDRMRARLASPSASAALREGWRAAADPAHEDEALRLLATAPDRMDGSFDTYVAVAVVLAARALPTDTARAVRLAETSAHAASGDVLPLVIGAIAHEHRGERTAARELLVRAFEIDAEDPAIAFSLAWRLEESADMRAALGAFDAYLAAMPEDRDMARRRARVALRSASLASAATYTRGGLTLVADRSISSEAAAHVLDVVDAGLTRSASLLDVARRPDLAIFAYVDRDAMHRATCVQGWAGAVFDGALETDAGTINSGRGDASLTHESFHAAVHPVVPNVPTWLDEGLAQYVSGEEGLAHVQSYELMVREHTWIPFASMNDAFLVIDDSADAGLAYHQALAMVEWLVERRGERGIRDAAHWLIDGGDATRVLAEAARAELDGETLLAFVQRHVAAMAAQGHAAPR